MKKLLLAASFVLAAPLTAGASELKGECLRVSEEWTGPGDYEAACTCFDTEVGSNQALIDEFMAFDDNYSSNEEAYEGASAEAKAVIDACEG
ncbi:MAG: hypothetical protein AAGH48_09630 [Pseudomonadota bacterium]